MFAILSLLGVLEAGASLAAAASVEPPPEPTFEVNARMPSGELAIGEISSFIVSIRVDPADAERFAWNLDDPDRSIARGRPILQLDVPESVELTETASDGGSAEDVLISHLGMPYGRRLLTAETNVAFRLKSKPGPDDVIGLNVIGYLGDDSREGSHFIRTRLHLPVSSGATAVKTDAADSSWGQASHLNIGDEADDFELPNTAGKSVRLSSLRGQAVIVTTYRGQW